MVEEKKEKEINPDTKVSPKTVKGSEKVSEKTKDTNSVKQSVAKKTPFKKNVRFKKRRNTRSKSEFDQKIIKIRRVTRVVKGGRRFSFSVAMVIGNRKGSVGVGVAKGADVALGIEKAVRKAKKDLIKLNLTANNSIPFEVEQKYCSSVIKIVPTKEEKGLSAGGSVKNVLELAGITDVTAKIISRSRNKLNNAMATLTALQEFKV